MRVCWSGAVCVGRKAVKSSACRAGAGGFPPAGMVKLERPGGGAGGGSGVVNSNCPNGSSCGGAVLCGEAPCAEEGVPCLGGILCGAALCANAPGGGEEAFSCGGIPVSAPGTEREGGGCRCGCSNILGRIFALSVIGRTCPVKSSGLPVVRRDDSGVGSKRKSGCTLGSDGCVGEVEGRGRGLSGVAGAEGLAGARPDCSALRRLISERISSTL